jgi:hypothetical protein
MNARIFSFSSLTGTSFYGYSLYWSSGHGPSNDYHLTGVDLLLLLFHFYVSFLTYEVVASIL